MLVLLSFVDDSNEFTLLGDKPLIIQIIKFCTNNNYLLANLKAQEIYFNNVGNFSDPFEGVFRFNLWNDLDKIKEIYLEHDRGERKGLKHYLKNSSELEKNQRDF